MVDSKSLSLRWERAKALSGWAVAAILAVSLIGLAAALTPTYGTVLQPGSMTGAYNYTVFQDAINSFVRDQTGAIIYSGTANSVVTSLIAAIGSTPQSVVFAQGNYSLTSSQTFPANVGVTLTAGAVITAQVGAAITFNGPFQAPTTQVFWEASTGTINFGQTALPVVYPDWFGITKTIGIQEAINSLGAKGGTVQLLEKTYYIKAPINMTSSGVVLQGHNGQSGGYIGNGNGVSPMINITGNWNALRDVKVNPSSWPSVVGIRVFNGNYISMTNTQTTGGLSVGLDMWATTGTVLWCTITGYLSIQNAIGIQLRGALNHGVNSNTFLGGYIASATTVGITGNLYTDTNTFVGMDIEGSLLGVDLTGNDYKFFGTRYEGNTQDIKFETGSYSNLFSGGSATYAKVTNGGNFNTFVDMIGVNFQGFSILSPGVPGSTSAQANTFFFAVRVYITGTGTGITAYAVTDQGGTTKTFTTTVSVGFYIPLQPGEEIALTYTGSPSWAWYGT